MAIPAPTTELAISSGSGASSSFTPQANSVLIVFGCADRASNAPGVLSLSNTGGLTFTEIVSKQSANNTGVGQRIAAWRANVGPSPSSMTITVSSTSASVILKHAISFPQSEVSPGDWPSTSGEVTSGGDPDFDLGSVGANSAVVATVISNGTGAFSPPSGHTEIADAGSGFCRGTSAYMLATANPDGQFTSSNGKSQIIAFEVKPKVVYTWALDPAAFNWVGGDLSAYKKYTMELVSAEYRIAASAIDWLLTHRFDMATIAYNFVPVGLDVRYNRRFDFGIAAYQINPGDLTIQHNRYMELGSIEYRIAGGSMDIEVIESGVTTMTLTETDYEFIPGSISVVYNRVFALGAANYDVTSDVDFLYSRRYDMRSADYNIGGGDIDMSRTRHMEMGSAAYNIVSGEANAIFYLIWGLEEANYDIETEDEDGGFFVRNRWRDTAPYEPFWQDTGIYG